MSVLKPVNVGLPDTWGMQEDALKALKDHLEMDRDKIAKQNTDSLNTLFSEAGLHNSIQKRGIAFIEGAKLILENNDPQGELSTLETYEKYWKDSPPSALTTQGLRGLILALCEELKQKVFQDDKKKTLENIRDKELTHAENHVNWGKRETLKTVLYLGPGTDLKTDPKAIIQVRIDTPITRFTKDQEKQWLKILEKENAPEWFKNFSKWERNYLIKRIEAWDKRTNLGDYLGVPPTTIRAYPGARNGYKSYFYTYERNKGQFLLKSQAFKIRSGHIAPDKMKDNTELLEAAKENIKQLILAHAAEQIAHGKTNLVFSVQTLITPPLSSEDRRMDAARLQAIAKIREELSSPGAFKKFLEDNDVKPEELKPTKDGKEVTLRFTLLTSNYPINYVRSIANFFGYLSSTRRNRENDTTLRTLNELCRHSRREAFSKATDLRDIDMAKAALAQMDAISGLMQRVSNFFRKGINHNAERAALEQIACSGLDVIRLGSCMSGKDREGGVSEHMAAKVAFYGKYGKFPPIPGVGSYIYWDKGERTLREGYEQMVAKEFLQGHEQAIANANASGANGLKVIGNILGSRVITQAKLILNEQLPGSDPSQAIQQASEMAALNRINKFSTNDTYRNLKSNTSQNTVVSVSQPTRLRNKFTPQLNELNAKKFSISEVPTSAASTEMDPTKTLSKKNKPSKN